MSGLVYVSRMSVLSGLVFACVACSSSHSQQAKNTAAHTSSTQSPVVATVETEEETLQAAIDNLPSMPLADE